jgi:hypothetical protein
MKVIHMMRARVWTNINNTYTIGSIFLVAIQWYMVRPIWRTTIVDMAVQSFGFF